MLSAESRARQLGAIRRGQREVNVRCSVGPVTATGRNRQLACQGKSHLITETPQAQSQSWLRAEAAAREGWLAGANVAHDASNQILDFSPDVPCGPGATRALPARQV